MKVRKLVLYWEVVTNYLQGNWDLRSELVLYQEMGPNRGSEISNGLHKFVRNLTEKTRNLGETEDICQQTQGKTVVQESRIVELSLMKTDKTHSWTLEQHA